MKQDMTEARVLTGLTLIHVNALYTAKEGIEKLFSKEGKRASDDSIFYECVMPDESPGVALVDRGGLGLSPVSIARVQLQKNNFFMVKLVVNRGPVCQVHYGASVKDVLDDLKRRFDERHHGLLITRAAVASRIDYALGLVNRVEPLRVAPRHI